MTGFYYKSFLKVCLLILNASENHDNNLIVNLLLIIICNSFFPHKLMCIYSICYYHDCFFPHSTLEIQLNIQM